MEKKRHELLVPVGNYESLIAAINNGAHAEVSVYGKIELMIIKNCPLNKIVNKNKVCSVCQNGKKYLLEDRNGAKYPIVNNPLTHSTSLLHHEVINKITQIKDLKDIGISSFRVELHDESYEKLKLF